MKKNSGSNLAPDGEKRLAGSIHEYNLTSTLWGIIVDPKQEVPSLVKNCEAVAVKEQWLPPDGEHLGLTSSFATVELLGAWIWVEIWVYFCHSFLCPDRTAGSAKMRCCEERFEWRRGVHNERCGWKLEGAKGVETRDERLEKQLSQVA